MTFITAQELRKTYQTKTGPVRALDGLNLSVEQGTVRGLLGPNGAGKTTVVKVLTTLLRPESGRVSVAGIDVLANPAKVRPLIGTSGQYAAVDEVLTARENLVLVGRLYRIGTRQAKRRAEELLEAFDLTEAADRPLKGFSGGMRRRVDLAGALVINPPVLFLDEPTTGLHFHDVRQLLDVLHRLRDGGNTIVVIEHNLDVIKTADWIVDLGPEGGSGGGEIIAVGTPEQIATNPNSYTGQFLKPLLAREDP